MTNGKNEMSKEEVEVERLKTRLHNARELAKKDWCPMCQTNRSHWQEQLGIDIASAERRLQELEEKIHEHTK